MTGYHMKSWDSLSSCDHSNQVQRAKNREAVKYFHYGGTWTWVPPRDAVVKQSEVIWPECTFLAEVKGKGAVR